MGVSAQEGWDFPPTELSHLMPKASLQWGKGLDEGPESAKALGPGSVDTQEAYMARHGLFRRASDLAAREEEGIHVSSPEACGALSPSSLGSWKKKVS